MKVVILCGGKGTRLREFTESIPKPLVELGNKPILWHIMKIYANYGHTDFILCLGYKAKEIEDYFTKEENKEPDWNITFIDTGEDTSKGERIKKVQPHIDEENFFVAYGDDVADVDLNKLEELHQKENKIVTLTAINPESQFGILQLKDNQVQEFIEKPLLDHWINGGFFIFNKKIFDHIKEGYDLEKETFHELAKQHEITAYKHKGFWKCMNTFKDTQELNELWNNKKAPWKVWE